MNEDDQTMKTQEKETRILNLKAEDAGHCWEVTTGEMSGNFKLHHW